MAMERPIHRIVRMEVKLSEAERDLFYNYAKELGINPTRLARNLIMQQAEKTLRNIVFYIPIVTAYKKYLKITNQTNEIKRIESDEETS